MCHLQKPQRKVIAGQVTQTQSQSFTSQSSLLQGDGHIKPVFFAGWDEKKIWLTLTMARYNLLASTHTFYLSM